MNTIILNSPEQIAHSLDVNKGVRVEKTCDSIIFAGMGGSWHPGEILNALHAASVPLQIHRDYGLPPVYGKSPLVITSSYSGNTEEALSAYEAAKKAGYAILVNTSGGKLEELSKQDNIPLAKIDYPGMQPRHTTFASFAGVATALANSGLAKDISNELRQMADTLTTVIPSQEEPGKQLAAKLKGTVPVYIASHRLAYAAWNFKIQTNENAKYPAFWNEIPEMNHNEMVGFSQMNNKVAGNAQFHAVFIRDNDDHPSNKARMDVTKELYENWGLTVSEVAVQGSTMLEKLFTTISFGLWTTYHLAQELNIDPVPVEGVENFKKRLKEITE